MAAPFGVYAHFPWCSHRCPYCDFAVETGPVPQARFGAALLTELARRAPAFAGLECRSLYVGGGTPSLWDPDGVAALVRSARGLGLRGGAEVTLEVNPESADPGRLAAYAAAGVTRFSVGVQSFDRAVLGKLGRRHRPEDAEAAVRAAAAAAADVSVDLIYGGRRSTAETARRDAERAAALPVTHVSAYALTLDAEALAEEVPLSRLRAQGRIALPADEEVLAQGRAIRVALRRAGFRRYEISSYARAGRASVHNRLYWAGQSWLGIGPGAHGNLGLGGEAFRWANHRRAAAWLADVEAGRLPSAVEERLGPVELARERVLLALRTSEGLPEAEVPPLRRVEIPPLLRRRLAVRRRGRIVLTSRGLDLHGAVAE
ncbi:MAG TPA: coproporphyrinogen-III oxidase family protein, partial [Anaeromyxobacteraceae bacterium]